MSDFLLKLYRFVTGRKNLLIFLLIPLITFSNAAVSQFYEFTLLLGGDKDDVGYSIVEGDNGYVLLASTRSFGQGSEDIMLVEIYKSGTLKRMQMFGNIRHDYPSKIIRTKDLGYCVVGSPWGGGPWRMDMYLMKFNRSLELEWDKYYGGDHRDEGLFMIQTNDGGFLLTGMTKSNGTVGDRYVVKTDEAGNAIWEKNFGQGTKDYSFCGAETSDGNFLIASVIAGFNYYSTFDFARSSSSLSFTLLDANGKVLWDKIDTTANHEFVRKIIEIDDEFYVLGSSQNGGNGSFDVLFEKLDQDGNAVFKKYFGGDSFEYGYDMIYHDNNFYVTGGSASNSNDNSSDVYCLKISKAGDLVWEKRFGEAFSEYGMSLIRNNNGGLVIIGETNKNGDKDILIFNLSLEGELIKFESQRESQAQNIFIYPNPSAEEVNFVVFSRINCIEYQLFIYDQLGKLVKQILIDSSLYTLEAYTLAAGTYSCIIESACAGTMTQKFIVR